MFIKFRGSSGNFGQYVSFCSQSDKKKGMDAPAISWKQYIQSLVDNKEINTIPNMITMSRIVASPLLSVAIAYDMKAVALGGCVLFGFSDWLDGYLAKKLNQKTVLGAFLDPMADKVMIGALTLGLVAKGLLPIPLACVIIGRDLTLVAASFALRAIERPAGSTFFDTTDSATFNIVPSDLSKVGKTLCNNCISFVYNSTELYLFLFIDQHRSAVCSAECHPQPLRLRFADFGLPGPSVVDHRHHNDQLRHDVYGWLRTFYHYPHGQGEGQGNGRQPRQGRQ